MLGSVDVIAGALAILLDGVGVLPSPIDRRHTDDRRSWPTSGQSALTECDHLPYAGEDDQPERRRLC